MTHKTAGQHIVEYSARPKDKLSIHEIQIEANKDFNQKLLEVMEDGKKVYEGDFFIGIDRIHNKALSTWFINPETGETEPDIVAIGYQRRHTKECPTPRYDLTVYHYKKIEDELFYLWTVPDAYTCHILKENSLNVIPQDREMLQHVLDFFDGTLDAMTRTLNNEKVDDPGIILYKKE